MKKNLLKKMVIASVVAFSGLSSNLTFATEAFDPQSPWMLGDWSGKRTELKDKGYNFTLGYTGDYAIVLGSEKGSGHQSAYADQINFAVDFDLAKILNWSDTEARINITKRGGNALQNESDALNGQMSQVQEIYGRGQTFRLTELYIKKKFFNGKLDLKVGRFGETYDFSSMDCEFMNVAICGSQFGNWANSPALGGSDWLNGPVSAWALRAKYNISPVLFAQIGVYEHNLDNLKRSQGFNLEMNGDGVVIPVEVVWSPLVNNLPGIYRVGYYTTTFKEKNADDSSSDHKQGAWFHAKQQVTSFKGDDKRGLSLALQVGAYDASNNGPIKDYQTVAATFKGLFDLRKNDEIGVGLTKLTGNTKYNSEYGSEYDAEIYYAYRYAPWLTIRPNIQYVKNIGGNKDKGDAWVGGVKFDLNF
ncbi:MAG: carbohydrate porin [Acinetobacter sp.]